MFLLIRRVATAGSWLAALCVLVVFLLAGCGKKEEVTPPSACLLTNSTRQGGGSSSTETWEYNADGQVKSNTPADGSRINYTYDGNGYLTAFTNLDARGAVSSIGQTTFANGRLAKVTIKDATGTITATDQYEYDGTGQLTKYTEQQAGGALYTYLYANGQQTGYVIRGASGSESQPYTFVNGLIKRATLGSNIYYSFEYDPQGRPTRYEIDNGSKLTGYSVFEYADGKPAEQARATFKGVPDLISSGTNQTGGGLPAKSTDYTISSTGVTTKQSETTNTYVRNTSGFPTESNEVYRVFDTAGNAVSTTTYKYTYQYIGCQ